MQIWEEMVEMPIVAFAMVVLAAYHKHFLPDKQYTGQAGFAPMSTLFVSVERVLYV